VFPVNAILTDEVGIEFGLLGKFRAKARYRPVYECAEPMLRPVAVYGEMAILQNGAEVDRQAVLGHDPSPAARQALDLLALTLVVRNHRRSDADALDLHLDFPKGPSRDISLEALEELSAPDIEAARITVFLDGAAIARTGVSCQLKAAGYRLGLAARLDDPGLADAIGEAKPHVVRIESDWLERAEKSPALGSLMARFVASCRDAGAEVMFWNVGARSLLTTARELGAGLLAGDALGRSLPAGAVMDLTPLPLAGPSDRAPNVLPFARQRQR
jgi:EAL domain-containing protein (putative c-di-GMP-specific phosphodiesterase class I)